MKLIRELNDHCALDMILEIDVYDAGLLKKVLLGAGLTLLAGTILTVTASVYICYYKRKRKGNGKVL